jgi:uncharacterized membrane protein YccC
MTRRESRPAVGAWLSWLALAVVTSALVFQKTKHPLLPASQTKALWTAEALALASVLILRSGWWRDADWAAEQARLGALVNDFYEPRRSALLNGFAVGAGVLAALWWGAATWSTVLFGMRRGVVTRGLFDFEVATLLGAFTGGLVGAVIGLLIGHVWERRHRRGRISRQSAHA